MSKEVVAIFLTMGSVNDEMSRSGVAINTKIHQGGPGEPYPEATLMDIYKKNSDGTE